MTIDASRAAEFQKPDRPDFLIVGTPRSGTTLVQRLARELSGVEVPPETHLFSLFSNELLSEEFPLVGSNLHGVINRYLDLPTSNGLPLVPSEVADRLEGRCDNTIHLFSAVVECLARADSVVIGEKTPDHLIWWQPLSAALPRLKIVGLVRDPRAVVASGLRVPWGMRHDYLLADRWRSDQIQLLKAQQALGPHRFLLLYYEEVVNFPEITREAIAGFLGVDSQDITEDPPSPLFMDWEAEWKHRAEGSITNVRTDVWKKELTEEQLAMITAMCRHQMEALGYAGAQSESLPRRLTPSARVRRAWFRRTRHRKLTWISAIAAGDSPLSQRFGIPSKTGAKAPEEPSGVHKIDATRPGRKHEA